MTPVLDAVRREELRKLAEAAKAVLDSGVRPEGNQYVAVYRREVTPSTTLALLAYIAELEAGRVEDHKWFDPRCHFDSCRSLILEAALKRLSFAAQTTGGVAGRDDELVAAIGQAEAALLPKASVREERK